MKRKEKKHNKPFVTAKRPLKAFMQVMPSMMSGKIWMLLPIMYVMNMLMNTPDTGDRAASHSLRTRSFSVAGSRGAAGAGVPLRAPVSPHPNEVSL